jgi:hypothetical protein
MEEKTSIVATPRASARLPAIRTATMTPMAIMSPYAFSRSGPMFNVPVDGLGIDANVTAFINVNIMR